MKIKRTEIKEEFEKFGWEFKMAAYFIDIQKHLNLECMAGVSIANVLIIKVK